MSETLQCKLIVQTRRSLAAKQLWHLATTSSSCVSTRPFIPITDTELTVLELLKCSTPHRQACALWFRLALGSVFEPTMHVPRLPDHFRPGRQASALSCTELGHTLLPPVPRVPMWSQGLQKSWQLCKSTYRAPQMDWYWVLYVSNDQPTRVHECSPTRPLQQ